MPLSHAVAWIDHHSAQVLQIDAEQVLDQKVKEHVHYTRQHGSKVRSEHEFFAEVCDALAGIESVLVAAHRNAQQMWLKVVSSCLRRPRRTRRPPRQ